MYKEFKNEMLGEMVRRRDLMVAEWESEDQLASLISVSNNSDKLYRKILNVFDSISSRYAEKLLTNLCKKHNITSERGKVFDLKICKDGAHQYIQIKPSPDSFDSASYNSFLERVNECDDHVSLVYLQKESMKCRKMMGENEEDAKKRGVKNLSILLFEELISELFGDEELTLFRQAMSTYNEEMHQIVGYQITEIFNEHNSQTFKNQLDNEIINYPYDSDPLLAKASYYSNARKLYIDNKRYKLLLGESDFAKSFRTSEWLYKKYFPLEDSMDNTYIVTGYLKSIEQLLWKIIYLRGQGKSIGKSPTDKKRVTINKTTTADDVNSTLGSLTIFIKDNTFIFDNIFRYGKNDIVRDLYKLLEDYRITARNGYFHQHNLDKNKIEEIRAKTWILYFGILGGLHFDPKILESL